MGGLLLQEAQAASVVLHLRHDGRAVATDGKWRFHRVAPDDIATLKRT